MANVRHTFDADGTRRIVETVRAYERQPLNRPQPRGRYPVPTPGGLTPYLMNETNAYWATGVGESIESQSAQSNGLEATEASYLAKRVEKATDDGFISELGRSEVVIDFQMFVGVHTRSPSDGKLHNVVWCRNMLGKLRAVGIGQTYWGYAEITTAVSASLVNPGFPGANSTGKARLYPGGPIVTVYYDGTIPESTSVDVIFDNVSQLFRVIVIHCEAVPEVS